MVSVNIAVSQPEKIIVHSNGTVDLIQHDSADEGGDESKQFVPVFTELEDGSLAPGVFYSGISNTGFHALEYPGAVVQDPIADFTGEGVFDFFDISVFLQAFAAGCP